MFAEVALAIPGLKPLTYRIPGGEHVEKGMRVAAPLGRRILTGVVVDIIDRLPREIRNLKSIIKILDQEPALNGELLDLGKWMAEYYYCSWGEALGAMLPAAYKPVGREMISRTELAGQAVLPRGTARRIMERLSLGALPRRELLRNFRAGAARVLNELHSRGLVNVEMKLPGTRRQPGSENHYVPTDHPPILNPHQTTARECIEAALDKDRYAAFLLHGVTGSGKTEVYLQAMAHTLEQGRDAIMLVPEIALTTHIRGRITARFGPRAAVLHSGLSGKERAEAWSRIHQGEARVVLGARSAVFAPVKKLGLIVVDEEYESSYKQEDVPRYQARDLAAVRARALGAVLVLGSATPAIESYFNAQRERYTLLSLPERVDNKKMPEIRIVDMSREISPRKGPPLFSRQLLQELEKRLAAGEQSILFLNRRGFAPLVMCPECRRVITCPDCSVSLVYHRADDKLHCHLCGRTSLPGPACPQCGAACLRLSGAGTQRVEEELRSYFPAARILRLDQDAVKKRGELEKTLECFGQGRTDILVGTQMVAKGMDFPHVTLVGIISADTALHLPDFRAEERTYQIVVQAAGRAGRGGRPGLVLIQTMNADHPVMTLAQSQNYPDFFQREIEQRRLLNYPPYARLASVICRSRNPEAAWNLAQKAAARLKRAAGPQDTILGPAPSPRERVARETRFQILIKSASHVSRSRVLGALQGLISPSGSKLVLDVDPLNML